MCRYDNCPIFSVGSIRVFIKALLVKSGKLLHTLVVYLNPVDIFCVMCLEARNARPISWGCDMDSKVLAALVADVLKQGQAVKLEKSQTDRFYREFESEVTEKMESLRAERRRAYEEVKNITIR